MNIFKTFRAVFFMNSSDSHSTLPKQRFTAKLPIQLIERARNAVYWTPGLTLAQLVADSLTQSLDALEAQRGEPFPPRQHELSPGRPIQSKPLSSSPN